MNAIIHNFQNELSRGERDTFAAHARLAGRRPGAHLKAILFGETEGAKDIAQGAEGRAHSAEVIPQSPSSISNLPSSAHSASKP